jgi:hypothetical protein
VGHVDHAMCATLTARVGGIIILALCVNGWSVDKCAESFERLAKLAFEPRPSLKLPIVSPLVDFLVSFFADGRYSAANLEAALQDTFGTDRSILDCSRATASGTRIGLPVTTIRDVSTCVFTNYNGVGSRPPGSGNGVDLIAVGIGLHHTGYHVLRPGDSAGRVLLWEM